MQTPRHTAFTRSVLIALALLSAGHAYAARPWVEVSAAEASRPVASRQITPGQARLIDLDLAAVRALTDGLPQADTASRAGQRAPTLTLPMPDGSLLTFQLHATEVMAPGLAARYPQIRTFAGVVPGRPHIRARFDLSPRGLRGQIFTPAGEVYLDPLSRERTDRHQLYFTRDLTPTGARPVDVVLPAPGTSANREATQSAPPIIRTGKSLLTYRIAFATTGEYAKYHDPDASQTNKALVLAEIVNVTNRVSGVYERDVGVRLQLIDQTDALIFTNANTDPYTNDDGGMMLDENITTLKRVLGGSAFDIGHVLSTGGGGVAYLGVVCSTHKAGGVTGSSNPVTDAFYIDYVAHEIGHQFNANHTFNSSRGSCKGNRAANEAYEPGSGTTIMAYAGICGADDLAPHSDANFHASSVARITRFTRNGGGASCAQVTASGNTPPVASVPAGGFTIPIGTPFELTGQGRDSNGDILSYQWEQLDLGDKGSPTDPMALSAPLFRSFPPSASPTRVFPRMADVLSGKQTLGELLPMASRDLNFRFTVRDNRVAPSAGGIATADLAFAVTAAAGPFKVTAPGAGGVFSAGSPLEVRWDVANTQNAPVSCASVDISLSTNGGNSFGKVLATAVPNSGSHTVTLPQLSTTKGRIKVKCSSNVFFNVSGRNFTIQ